MKIIINLNCSRILYLKNLKNSKISIFMLEYCFVKKLFGS